MILKPEEKAELDIINWFKNSWDSEIYVNRDMSRITSSPAPVFKVKGDMHKPDLVMKWKRFDKYEYIAVEVKPASSSRNIHDSGKILMYYEKYINGDTKYYIDNEEINIQHFAVITDNSHKGYFFPNDVIISNLESDDNWRKVNAKYGHMPEFEYQRTSDYLRTLWSRWRDLKTRLKIHRQELPSIGIIISKIKDIKPTTNQQPYFFTQIWTYWLSKPEWKQRFFPL